MHNIHYKTQPIYTNHGVRTIDAAALKDDLPLMQRAGQAVMDCVNALRTQQDLLICLVGNGNNGGDALVVARLACMKGYRVVVLMHEKFLQKQVKGDAFVAWLACQNLPIEWLELSVDNIEQVATRGASIWVDGILGVGLQGELQAHAKLLIEKVNRLAQPVVAIDLPSGLNSLTGQAMPIAIQAIATVCLVVRKLALYTGDAVDYIGKVYVADLATKHYWQFAQPVAHLLENVTHHPRPRSFYKGLAGCLLIHGSCLGMLGASKLAALAAFRLAGCGKVLVNVEAGLNAQSYFADLPELMMLNTQQKVNTKPLTAQLVGPGLGMGAWAKAVWRTQIDYNLPTVLDADGLNMLATNKKQRNLFQKDLVLTPHVGEAARLLGVTQQQIQANRLQAIEELVQRYQATVVLKGAGTLIANAEKVYVIDCADGNMAVAGMGDALAGAIGGLLASGLSSIEAAIAGVWEHTQRAKWQSQQWGRGLLPSDLCKNIEQKTFK